MTLTLPTAGTLPTFATLIASHAQPAVHRGHDLGSTDGICAPDVDLDRLVGALRLERRAAESVATRLHLLALAVGGAYPVSIDAADLGVCDAVDQLRQCDLLRAVLMTDALGSVESSSDDVGHRSFNAHHDHAYIDAVAPPTVTAITAIVDDLAAAVEAIDAACAAALAVLDDERSGASARRRGALRHLVHQAVPAGLRIALG